MGIDVNEDEAGPVLTIDLGHDPPGVLRVTDRGAVALVWSSRGLGIHVRQDGVEHFLPLAWELGLLAQRQIDAWHESLRAAGFEPLDLFVDFLETS